MALISQSDVEARIGRSLTAEEQSSFTTINSSAQAFLEGLIGSRVESVSATTRYYDGGLQLTPIDPCTSITAVKHVDEDQATILTLDTSDYTKEPINGTVKTAIRYRHGAIYSGINNIAVTGRFSIYEDGDTLAIVKDTLISMVVMTLNNANNLKRETIEGYSVEYSDTQYSQVLAPIKARFQTII